MKSGVILIDKATGLSSAAVVGRLKRSLHLDRIGHAGTLDPMASGLLVCLCGAATRLADYAQGGIKVYSGEIQLGIRTSSDDLDGEILTRSEEIPSFATIESAIPAFVGHISQVPPRISAVKIDGERSYRRARRGEDFEITARQVQVLAFEIAPLADPSRVAYRVRCSKGTYIRSLARDLGEKLGCGACIATLRREITEPFSVASAKSLEDVTAADILPWNALFPSITKISVTETEARRLLNGERRVLADVVGRLPSADIQLAVYGADRPLGLLRNTGKVWDFVLNVG